MADFPSVVDTFNPTTDINIERILDGESTLAMQEPTGVGPANAIRINFGPAVNTVADPANLLANGQLQINVAGLYHIKISLQFGRTGTGGTSILLFRVASGGVQLGRSVYAKIANENTDRYFENDTWAFFPAGFILDAEIMRDSAGTDSGGLFRFVPTAAGGAEWNAAPSAAIRVERWIGG